MRRNNINNTAEKLPDDAVFIEARGPWEIHYSASEHAVLVKTTDYYPGILKLTKRDLRRFAEIDAK